MNYRKCRLTNKIPRVSSSAWSHDRPLTIYSETKAKGAVSERTYILIGYCPDFSYTVNLHRYKTIKLSEGALATCKSDCIAFSSTYRC